MRDSIFASRCSGFQFHQTLPSVELLRWCLSSILSEKSSKVILSFSKACYPGTEFSEARTGCLKWLWLEWGLPEQGSWLQLCWCCSPSVLRVIVKYPKLPGYHEGNLAGCQRRDAWHEGRLCTAIQRPEQLFNSLTEKKRKVFGVFTIKT